MKLTQLFVTSSIAKTRPRRALEHVPAGLDDWKPHPKSMPLGRLAASCIHAVVDLAHHQQAQLDINPRVAGSSTAKTSEMVQALDEHVTSGLNPEKYQ